MALLRKFAGGGRPTLFGDKENKQYWTDAFSRANVSQMQYNKKDERLAYRLMYEYLYDLINKDSANYSFNNDGLLTYNGLNYTMDWNALWGKDGYKYGQKYSNVYNQVMRDLYRTYNESNKYDPVTFKDAKFSNDEVTRIMGMSEADFRELDEDPAHYVNRISHVLRSIDNELKTNYGLERNPEVSDINSSEYWRQLASWVAPDEYATDRFAEGVRDKKIDNLKNMYRALVGKYDHTTGKWSTNTEWKNEDPNKPSDEATYKYERLDPTEKYFFNNAGFGGYANQLSTKRSRDEVGKLIDQKLTENWGDFNGILDPRYRSYSINVDTQDKQIAKRLYSQSGITLKNGDYTIHLKEILTNWADYLKNRKLKLKLDEDDDIKASNSFLNADPKEAFIAYLLGEMSEDDFINLNKDERLVKKLFGKDDRFDYVFKKSGDQWILVPKKLHDISYYSDLMKVEADNIMRDEGLLSESSYYKHFYGQ